MLDLFFELYLDVHVLKILHNFLFFHVRFATIWFIDSVITFMKLIIILTNPSGTSLGKPLLYRSINRLRDIKGVFLS